MFGGDTSSPKILAIEPCRLGATWKNVYIMTDELAQLFVGGAGDLAFFIAQDLGFGYIMEGTGFWAATQLGVMATINALTRPGFPMKTFGNPDELSSWMAPLLPSFEGTTLTGADLAAAVRSAREKLPSVE